ncbi:HNH endonuclease [Lactobacillus kefiranofaciens]|uniref:HNH endonuclease n=1 Tax=Lactobacillus kefiranofaciens TaxID=267818 RepID=UPI0012E3AE6F|nr:HNH endonuclease [Lactobacillus kefiranofaciens]MCJ2172708.1 HNH endonuclease [Lactobacillus kefiranofaciens]MDF4142952.1 HNH endonuclease [Lactobacillus kefiranofaciens]QNT44285.1 HNH endonuclease [Lactobacillus kefiranofaciens]
MKFLCSSCGLRMDSLHFKQEGLMNPKLTSICDICLMRGLDPHDYSNYAVATFAQSLLYTYEGKKDDAPVKPNWIVQNKKARKRYEDFLQDYDGNEIARQQVKREDLNLAIIKSEDGEIDYIPDQDVTFAQNMEKLGLKIDFQLNEVNFIDRERIRAKYKYRCQYCGRRGHSVDHKDPVSLSHNNDLTNLTLACAECNRIKSDMPYKLFIQLNSQITKINKKLVKYENALGTLQEEFKHRRRYLAAQVHLKGVINDPELNAIRKQNKQLQDAIDSLQSDYDDLRETRKTYFETGWKLARIKANKDII